MPKMRWLIGSIFSERIISPSTAGAIRLAVKLYPSVSAVTQFIRGHGIYSTLLQRLLQRFFQRRIALKSKNITEGIRIPVIHIGS